MTKNITIPNPRTLEAEKLVLIPRVEYRALLRVKRDGIREVVLTNAEKKAITRSRKEIERGDYLTLDELEKDLDRSLSKIRR